jgi:hypothetical protein
MCPEKNSCPWKKVICNKIKKEKCRLVYRLYCHLYENREKREHNKILQGAGKETDKNKSKTSQFVPCWFVF